MGLFSKASASYEQAIKIMEKAHGPEHPDTARILNNLADLYVKQGHYSDAEAIHIQALAIREKTHGTDHQDTADSLNNLGNLYRIMGDNLMAERILKKSLLIREAVLGQNNNYVAQSLSDLGYVYSDQGKYSMSESLLERSLAITEAISGPDHIDTARLISNLGTIYMRQGEHARAESKFIRALEIMERVLGPGDPELATVMSELGNLYITSGQYLKAKVALEKSIDIKIKALGANHPEAALVFFNLAKVYSSRGEMSKAESLYRKSIAIAEKSLGPRHVSTGSYIGGLALLYKKTGQNRKAEPLYIQSLAIVQKALGEDHPDVATYLTNISAMYLADSRYKEGVGFLRRGLATKLKWFRKEVQFLAADRREAQLESLGNTHEVIYSLAQVYKPAASLALEIRLNTHGLLQEIERKQGLLINATSDQRQLAEQILSLTQQMSGISVQPGIRNELRNQLEKKEAELYRQLPELAIESVTPSKIAKLLPKDGVLIEFQKYYPYNFRQRNNQAWGEPQYIALSLNPNGVIDTIQLGKAKRIDKAIHQALKATTDNNSDNSKLWAEVGKLILNPLKNKLRGHSQWFFSPDSELNRIPFSVLPSPIQTTETVGTAVKLRLLTTGAELVRLQKGPSAGQKPLVMANPNYDSSKYNSSVLIASINNSVQKRSGSVDSDRWNQIPATKYEGDQVAKLLSTESITGDQATTLKLQQSNSPRVIHVATHGFFAADKIRQPSYAIGSIHETGQEFKGFRGEDPMLRSGLVLAGANHPNDDPNDDGYLTASEAAKLQLEGTELVVLSACSTGQGDIRSGEGVYGLQRALTVAGARSTLLSLWKVDDKATAEFMIRFYKHLLAGDPRSDALGATQKEFRDGKVRDPQSGLVWNSPYYWAAWQLTGDWRPIQGL